MTNKLIDRLEEITEQFTELTNEAKVIFQQLRRPSTIQTVEDVIEFEGQQYKKVDREAREGDVIVFRENTSKVSSANVPYKAINGEHDISFVGDIGNTYQIYNKVLGRTKETVDVYELIVEDKSKIQGITIEIDAPKSANQLRAEVIEKAKKFLEKKKVTRSQGGNEYKVYINRKTLNWVNADFIVNAEKRTVVCLVRWTKDKSLDGRGIAKCMPTDVFNEHIGKAIALGRALGLDVSEFENAPQPNRRTNGMVIEWRGGTLVIASPHVAGKTCDFDSEFARYGTIINDTNAEYEVNA